MPRWRFVLGYFVRPLLLPFTLAKYEWAYIHVNVLGKGGNVYMRRVPDGDAGSARPRLGTTLGFLYLLGFIAVTGADPHWLPTGQGERYTVGSRGRRSLDRS